MPGNTLKFRRLHSTSLWPAADSPAISRPAQLLTLAAMSPGYGVVQLDVTIVNTALASIANSLGGGVSELQHRLATPTRSWPARMPRS